MSDPVTPVNGNSGVTPPEVTPEPPKSKDPSLKEIVRWAFRNLANQALPFLKNINRERSFENCVGKFQSESNDPIENNPLNSIANEVYKLEKEYQNENKTMNVSDINYWNGLINALNQSKPQIDDKDIEIIKTKKENKNRKIESIITIVKDGPLKKAQERADEDAKVSAYISKTNQIIKKPFIEKFNQVSQGIDNRNRLSKIEIAIRSVAKESNAPEGLINVHYNPAGALEHAKNFVKINPSISDSEEFYKDLKSHLKEKKVDERLVNQIENLEFIEYCKKDEFLKHHLNTIEKVQPNTYESIQSFRENIKKFSNDYLLNKGHKLTPELAIELGKIMDPKFALKIYMDSNGIKDKEIAEHHLKSAKNGETKTVNIGQETFDIKPNGSAVSEKVLEDVLSKCNSTEKNAPILGHIVHFNNETGRYINDESEYLLALYKHLSGNNISMNDPTIKNIRDRLIEKHFKQAAAKMGADPEKAAGLNDDAIKMKYVEFYLDNPNLQGEEYKNQMKEKIDAYRKENFDQTMNEDI